MSSRDLNFDHVNDYGAVHISLASPQDIRSWSFGQVKKSNTMNRATGRPEKGGLFCEQIFGPVKDWECACGKYCGIKHQGMVCDFCGVKVAHSRVRRQRMGHIELAAPVVHAWFVKMRPSPLAVVLNIKSTTLAKIVYFQEYVVTDPGMTPLNKNRLLTEQEYLKARDIYGDTFAAYLGADAVKKMLERVNLTELSRDLRRQLEQENAKSKPSRAKMRALSARLKVVEAFRLSGQSRIQNRPDWMVLECLPVIPPGLRPLVQPESGNQAPGDLNDLYRHVINRNNRLIKLVFANAPEVIIINEKRMLQLAVDALLGSPRCHPVGGQDNRPHRSLTGRIQENQGRLRKNLLSKRVDYSGRAIVVPDSRLGLHQCGLPKEMALVLFKPFVHRRLKELLRSRSVKNCKKIGPQELDIWSILDEVSKNHPVLLSHPPMLRRAGIQAFEPLLVEDDAIHLHPLACQALKAEPGDQLSVHLPLSTEAQVEAAVLMTPDHILFSPANGQPLISPSQDIVLGCNYLTATRGELGESGEPGEGKSFASVEEVLAAYSQKKLGVHARIQVRLPLKKRFLTEVQHDKIRFGPVERKPNGLVLTTVGRVIFNDILHSDMGLYDVTLSHKHLQRILADCHEQLGQRQTIELLERIKALGFRQATASGLSLGIGDLKTPGNKQSVLAQTEKSLDFYRKQYDEGNILETERYNKALDLWTHARDLITKQVMDDLKNDKREGFPYLHPLYLMAYSGTCSTEHISQLAGMRGLMAKPNGAISETPIKANLREGLSVLEYFLSTLTVRRGLASDARRRASAQALTSRLTNAAQDVVVTRHDCGTDQGVKKTALFKDWVEGRSLAESLRGRVSCNTVVLPDTQEVLVQKNKLITPEMASKIERLGIDKVLVRSPMTCRAPWGVCQLCYGIDPTTGQLVEEGTAVGILAALALGELAAQLTTRSFFLATGHITSSLPRLRELFEAPPPSDPAILAQVTGLVTVGQTRDGQRQLFIQPVDGQGKPYPYVEPILHEVPLDKLLCVATGDRVNAGDRLVPGTLVPHDILNILGIDELERWLMQEIQTIYRTQRLEIDDKHIEIIVAQMLRKVRVQHAGDTDLVPGSLLDKFAFVAVNEQLTKCVKVVQPGASRFEAGQIVPREVFEEERVRLETTSGQRPTFTAPLPASGCVHLLGITDVARQSDSFLAAASFQEAAKVLTEAALAGKVDPLAGLKENALLGRLVPVGTGFHRCQEPLS